MLQRIRAACGNPNFIYPLCGVVEIDETYIGGLEKNKHANKKRRSGRGAVGKFPIVSVWQRNKTGKGKGTVNSFAVPNATKEVLHTLINNFVEKGSTIHTDEHLSYTGLPDKYIHKTVNHSRKEYVRDEVHTNGVESFFARLNLAFYGTHGFFTEKHASGYAAEMSFRQNIRASNTSDSISIFALLLRTRRVRVTYSQLKQAVVQYHVYPRVSKYWESKYVPRDIARNRKYLLENPFTPDEFYLYPIVHIPPHRSFARSSSRRSVSSIQN